jgi:hypothetical protein
MTQRRVLLFGIFRSPHETARFLARGGREHQTGTGTVGGIVHLKLKDGKWRFSDLEVMWLLD